MSGAVNEVKMPVEAYKEETRVGTVYHHAVKTRCKLCRVDTKDGHPITVCVFALARKVERLEAERENRVVEVSRVPARG